MKGKRITIVKESIGKGGVITTTILDATVEYSNGDGLTVKGSDGYIYEVERNNRDDDGAYYVVN